jgi:L-fucose isomerase-like protein
MNTVDKNLGVDIVDIPAAEYNALFDSIAADASLQREAMAFKAKATAVIDVEDRYIIDGFRARRAVHEIMKRYGADAITITCLMLQERKPCIAFSLNNSALIPCGCENDADSTMTMMIGAHLFHRGGFQHNPEFDIDRNHYYGAHCTCALEMHGPGKKALPFRIRPFTHQLPKTAAIDVKMTPGEKVFVTKYFPSSNSVFAYTGTMIGSPEINVAGGCATRFVMDVDKIDEVCSIYHGPHPILFFGSATEAKRMKMFAKLARLEFIGNI